LDSQTVSVTRPYDARTDRWVASDGVELLLIGARCAIFHEGRQELVELNATACHIWLRLADGETASQVALSLADAGASRAASRTFVGETLTQWLSDGWLTPAKSVDDPRALDARMVNLAALGVTATVTISGAPPPGLYDLLEGLKGDGASAWRLHIAAWRGRYLFYLNGRSRGLFASNQIVAAVKALLTEHVVTSTQDGFFCHGALLTRSSRRLFLSGPPGSGKSTLALALACSGFECHSDDLAHVDCRGQMRGAPFAPTIKTGAWSLFSSRLRTLEEAPVHRRADGQFVRYIPGVISPSDSRPFDYFIALDRAAANQSALEPLAGLDALRMLLEGSYAARLKLTAAQIAALAEGFRGVSCYTLHYADVWAAVSALEELVDG
jgi:hypothetical protein